MIFKIPDYIQNNIHMKEGFNGEGGGIREGHRVKITRIYCIHK